MQTYREFQPTGFDPKGLGLEDRQDWLVLPIGRNRDSGALARSNWRVVLRDLGGESDTLEVHRFGHWACGWFEIALIHPSREAEGAEWERALDDYPAADDEDFSAEENAEAQQVWEQSCAKDRLEYIRKHRNQFNFRNFADLLGCVRGHCFCGHASELLS